MVHYCISNRLNVFSVMESDTGCHMVLRSKSCTPVRLPCFGRERKVSDSTVHCIQKWRKQKNIIVDETFKILMPSIFMCVHARINGQQSLQNTQLNGYNCGRDFQLGTGFEGILIFTFRSGLRCKTNSCFQHVTAISRIAG